MKVVTSSLMREIDRQTVDRFGVPSITLMENAGAIIADLAISEYSTKKPVIICGRGGNGGDGFVCARHLAMQGIQSKVYLLSSTEYLKGDTAINFGILAKGFSGVVELFAGTSDEQMAALSSSLQEADLIIDAMIGTGLTRAPAGETAQAIELACSVRKPILSVDMPSGVDGSSGAVPGISIKADTTCTFGVPKIGQLLYPGATKVGKLVVANVGFPNVLIDDPELQCNMLTDTEAKNLLPIRPDDSHKGKFGSVVIIGGSKTYPGAPLLSALGSIKTGAGLTRLVVPDSIYGSVAGRYPEVIVNSVKSSDGAFSTDDIDEIINLAHKASVVVIGPGLSRNHALNIVVNTVLSKIESPVIVDADALYALSSSPQGLNLRAENGLKTILTPHWGEAGRFGSTAYDITKDPISTANRFSKRFGTITVLKSSRSVISSPIGQYHINATGNSALSKGGSGDVLSGVIAALIAQNVEPYSASVLGSYLLGKSAERLSAETGTYGVLASEIAKEIPNLMKELSQQ
ncbi:MAG TPA: NAD(P)H-hydrate dehydratase [Caldisericia bacterium]|nr:NAD(P)H-hydrate dehydratase [Caldisericia bacterium]HPF48979.1 NAD(P)H-hydrate dehydratase [Caldisericia bacterium]HPI83157.1 NAD(P)H-hydrate dehydratase [Caldisericia bacterium]HPQ92384.1 NAD(P)H-hydrate dehydratase [Caldisericia bacterium]HRV74518.1 NAD(P)H-hydrate dehydratase [Caldisericia bacterium]